MMKNPFYKRALSKASGLKGNSIRIASLLVQGASKLKKTDWSKVSLQSIKNKLSVLLRIGNAYVRGEYRNIPWKSLTSLLAAVIYFANPFDLLPDLMPIIGLTDDFAILAWVYNSILDEINKFLEWEQTQLPT